MIAYVLQPMLPFIQYQLNYGYISEKLCENKAKPKLQCNGKCYLKKQLKKTSEQEQADAQKSAKKAQKPFDSLTEEKKALLADVIVIKRSASVTKDSKLKTVYIAIPKPPPQRLKA